MMKPPLHACRLRRRPVLARESGALIVRLEVATLVAVVAVEWRLGHIRSHRFTSFALFRIAVGVAVMLLVPARA